MPTEDLTEPASPGSPEQVVIPDVDSLLAAWELTLPGQQAMAERLLVRYAERHRHYHTATHLAQVLTRINQFAEPDHDLFLVKLAAWFHDAVYLIPPGQVENEEASARLARRELGRAGLEQEDLNEVARLVRLTATHVPGTRDKNGELLCDADLAILASDERDYRGYVTAVREEYAQVPALEFAAGRLEILENLIETDIFRTAQGRKLNEQAQVNLERECEELRAVLELPEGSR